ncbi:ThiF family adenylyltransferase [Cohnella sp. REN36]|uniref:ThiF family adenylyltransferase n=1 Tax=Cohnella sp. REN36 TaxID=2887347 RepID=UPI001D139C35|nr:ThiF family adenylyltransferase [Cohnella sp. REN36]MCC3375691.1 ThiF family adenylyltransferase [Cohnella sp. REN36]
MTGFPPEERYARQIRFAPIGAEGQARIGRAHVAIVGVGALGCVVANQLARAGVGTLTLVDRDVVDASNLQRQLLYDERDAASGTPKAVAAARRLAAANGGIAIRPHAVDLTAANADTLLGGADLVVDGTDNFGVRYLMNEWCVRTGTPWIYGAAVGASGMTMTVLPGQTPCLRCLFPEPPPGGSLDTCETAGVVAPIVDTIASIEAMEALKLLAGRTEALHGKLLQVDLWRMEWQPLGIGHARRADCPVCAERRFELLEGDTSREPVTAALCGRNTVQVSPAEPAALDLERLAGRWRALGDVELNAYLLRLRRTDGLLFSLFPDGRALISGTDDPGRARRVYTELLGE